MEARDCLAKRTTHELQAPGHQFYGKPSETQTTVGLPPNHLRTDTQGPQTVLNWRQLSQFGLSPVFRGMKNGLPNNEGSLIMTVCRLSSAKTDSSQVFFWRKAEYLRSSKLVRAPKRANVRPVPILLLEKARKKAPFFSPFCWATKVVCGEKWRQLRGQFVSEGKDFICLENTASE